MQSQLMLFVRLFMSRMHTSQRDTCWCVTKPLRKKGIVNDKLD